MKRNWLIGLVLIGLGAFLIVQRTVGFEIDIWNFLWPLFLLIPGISIHINYFSRKGDSGSLVVGGILIVYGILFIYNAATNWAYSGSLSFVYPLGIGIGFFESFIFGDKRNSNLSISIIFIVIAVYMLLKDMYPDMANLRDYIIPGILILLGISVLLRNKR